MSASNTVVEKKSGTDVRKMTTMAMLVAIGVILMALIEVPIFPAAPFLKYDPADIPILIGTLIYGPVAGLIMTFVISFIQSFLIHGSSGVIGFVMHVIATGAMVLVTGLWYKMRESSRPRLRAALALIFGALAMVVFMVLMNLIITPMFMGAPVETVVGMLIPVIIPFNVIKAGLNCIIAFIVYKYVEKLAVR